jgi:hypothetical protein
VISTTTKQIPKENYQDSFETANKEEPNEEQQDTEKVHKNQAQPLRGWNKNHKILKNN